MRILRALLVVLPLVLPAAASAQRSPVVVELYTSQGCSSCPPADALLTELAARPDVIALALHVDYWDYLGWADSFARPEFTARQRAYAKRARSRTIYTPQMIVQGEDRLVGSEVDMVLGRVAAHEDRAASVTLTLEREGDDLRISLAPVSDNVGPSDVHLVAFEPSRSVSIEGGENAGHDMTYSNVVTDWESVGRWDGTTPVQLRYEGLEAGPGAVIVQKAHMGPVMAAARF